MQTKVCTLDFHALRGTPDFLRLQQAGPSLLPLLRGPVNAIKYCPADLLHPHLSIESSHGRKTTIRTLHDLGIRRQSHLAAGRHPCSYSVLDSQKTITSFCRPPHFLIQQPPQDIITTSPSHIHQHTQSQSQSTASIHHQPPCLKPRCSKASPRPTSSASLSAG